MKCLVIDGKLPVSTIVARLVECAMSGAGAAIDFDGVEDAEVKQIEINAMIREINNVAGARVRDDELSRAPSAGNRKARRAAAAQRRGKW